MRRDPLGLLTDVAREYGDAARLRIGAATIFVFSHPDLVREVLVTRNRSFIKTRVMRRTRRLLGEGLLTSEDDVHLRQRRLAQPAFHRDRIAGYARTMVDDAERLAVGWRDGQELDIHREMMRLTLHIAGKTLFGAEVGAAQAAEIGEALDAALRLFRRALVPFADLIDRLPLPSNRRFFRSRDRLDGMIYRMILQRRASAEDTGDLLSMLILARDAEADGGTMSDEQVRDEAVTLLLAGHETTANALAWTWYLLARHPAAEEALHAEVDSVLGGRLPTADDLPRLPYTRAVLAESMRLFPPAWVISREAVEDLEIGGVAVPRGTMIFLSEWVIHRDPRFWDEPERFLPERWLDGLAERLPRFAYFPFGGGTRKCIGEAFAWTEGMLVLATLSRRWRLRLLPGQRVEPLPLITLRPRHGIGVRVEGRG
jgi:cytochrome P450